MIRQALILAGGFGTRLGALTKERPKPMLEVAGRPFLEYLIFNLKRFGFSQIVLSVGYLHKCIETHFMDGRKFGVSIDYSRETSPLGTGGGIRNAAHLLGESFLVLNGDTIFDCNYAELALMLSPVTTASIALRHVEDASRYGGVCLEGDRILKFVEKGKSGPGLVSAGVYALTRSILVQLPEGYSSIERDLFPQLAARGELYARVSSGFFIDIGLPETLAKADDAVPTWMAGLKS